MCALADPNAFAQGGAVAFKQRAEKPFTPTPVLIDLYSGNGVQGGDDAEILALQGPFGGFIGGPGPAEFAAARNAGPAAILSNAPWSTIGLESHPLAKWIGPDQAYGQGSNQSSVLFAMPFEVPTEIVGSAYLDLVFSADETLGDFGVAGVFINEQPVNDTTIIFSDDQQNILGTRAVGKLLRPGTNWIYFYNINAAFFGGLMFHARLRVNLPRPDACVDAIPAYIGVQPGSNATAFTSGANPPGCGVDFDRWYYFVPPASGAFTATVAPQVGSSIVPSLAVYSGDCGNLSQIGCKQGLLQIPGPEATPATHIGQATAGEPILLRVGGAIGTRGPYTLTIDVESQLDGLVYPANGHLYKLTPTLMDIPTARNWAAQAGGYLAAVNDAAENDWIQSNLASNLQVWLGLSDEVTEGVWLWDSGEPFTFDSWNATEPNDFALCGGEDYVEMEGGGLWNDLNTGLNPCANHIRRGLVEIPTSGLAAVSSVGGACAPTSITPELVSEPHQLGSTVDLGVLGGAPLDPFVVFRSPFPAMPNPSGDCVIHVDQLALEVIFTGALGTYGSASFQFSVPSDPALIGAREAWQAEILSPISGSYFSNGLEVLLGN